jgi:hypothetical protein
MSTEDKTDEILKLFIESCDFTWTVDEIKAEYKKMVEGIYVSHSAKICCVFYDRLLRIMRRD